MRGISELEKALWGKVVTVEYVDDIDGVTIKAEAVDTVQFSYRGRDYALVLSKKNGAQFDKEIARHITAVGKAKARDQRPARTTAGPTPR